MATCCPLCKFDRHAGVLMSRCTCRKRGIKNLTVLTADLVDFQATLNPAMPAP